ncbi:MAG: glycosyltransferase, partial [Acidimicrobiales bacterium]
MAATVAVALGWLGGFWLLWRIPRLAAGAGTLGAVPVAVVIPARDEAANLPTLLASLAAQTRRPGQVVVVDDHSADATAAVAAAAGATVVAAPDLPPGWTGKSWA